MNLILMGLPGAGKGTQAEKIIDTYKIPHISTGDMFRAAIADQTELGLEAKRYMDNGELVPDEVTTGIVKERLAKSDCDNGFLLDGFPRTMAQAESLQKIMSELNKKIDAVINIEVDPEVIVDRLSGRFICRNCGATYHKLYNQPEVEGTCDRCQAHDFYQREDDKPETVKNRLSVNIENSKPILEFYKEAGIRFDVDGDRDINDVFEDVKQVIENEAR